MSAAASWSYTRAATVWPRLSSDDWVRQAQFGAPQTFACDYTTEARKAADDRGEEFVTRTTLFTERADIKRGDMVAVGSYSQADPTAVPGAEEVRAVARFSDTFNQRADDFKVMT